MAKRTIIGKTEQNKNIERLIGSNTTYTDILHLFSAYIASNPDFKYNRTYLTDVIDTFIKDLKSYRDDIEEIKKILKKKIPNIPGSKHTTIYIDDIIEITISKNEVSEIIIEPEKESSFRFDKVSEKKHSLTLIYEKNDSDVLEHCYTLDLYKDSKLEEKINECFENFKTAIYSVIMK